VVGFHLPHASSTLQRSNIIPSSDHLTARKNHVSIGVEEARYSRSYTLMKMKLNESLNDSESEESQIKLSLPQDKPILAILDFCSLAAFAAIGKASHAADGSIDIGAVLITALPFLVSWFATSPFTGVYADTPTKENDGIFDVTKVVAKGWIVAVPLGCVGRGLIKGYVPPLPFVIVTMIATLVILTAVRLIYSFIGNKIAS